MEEEPAQRQEIEAYDSLTGALKKKRVSSRKRALSDSSDSSIQDPFAVEKAETSLVVHALCVRCNTNGFCLNTERDPSGADSADSVKKVAFDDDSVGSGDSNDGIEEKSKAKKKGETSKKGKNAEDAEDVAAEAEDDEMTDSSTSFNKGDYRSSGCVADNEESD